MFVFFFIEILFDFTSPSIYSDSLIAESNSSTSDAVTNNRHSQ